MCMAKIKSFLDRIGERIYLITHSDAVVCTDSKVLTTELEEIKAKLDNYLIVTVSNFDVTQGTGTCSATSIEIKTAMSEGKPVYLYEEDYFRGYLLLQSCWGEDADYASYITYYNGAYYKFVVFEDGSLTMTLITDNVTITIDDNLITDSDNPVKNSAITSAINTLTNNVGTNASGISGLDTRVSSLENEEIPPFIKILASGTTRPETADTGYYIYYNDSNVPALYYYNGNVWTEQTEDVLPKAYIVFADEIWLYEGGQMTDTGVSLTLDKETVISEATKNSTNPPTTAAVYNVVNANTEDITELDNRVSDLEDISGGSAEEYDETLYPEYYGAKGDGINYYDWPLRCYNGEVNVAASSISNERYATNVFAPSEKIANTYEYTIDLDTTSVYWNTATSYFVLLVDGTYYKLWGTAGEEGSSEDWQDAEGHVREDTVFSNIAQNPNEDTGVLMRISYIWKDGAFTDINDTMTDDTQAIYDCLIANKGSMRLHNKIYYMHPLTHVFSGLTTDSNPFYNISNFTIDGGEGILFVRTTGVGQSYTNVTGNYSNVSVFYLYKTFNGCIKNLRMYALRDRDNGAPGGHLRFSSSCSRLQGFLLYSDLSTNVTCGNIRWENVHFKNMYADINIKGGYGYTMDGWYSEGVANQEMYGAKDTLINNAHISQAKYLGDGMHLFYGGSFSNGFTVTNSSFMQPDKYNSVMITMHGHEEGEDTSYAQDMKFINCFFYGGALIQGNSGAPANHSKWYFDGCVFYQAFTTALTSVRYNSGGSSYTSPHYYTLDYISIASKQDYTLKRCLVNLNGAGFAKYANRSTTKLILDTTRFLARGNGYGSGQVLIAGFAGTFESANCTMGNWAGTLGSGLTLNEGISATSVNAEEVEDIIEEVMGAPENYASSTDMTQIKTTLYGSGAVADASGVFAARPKGTALGSTYLATDTGKLYQCTNVGAQSRIPFRIERGHDDGDTSVFYPVIGRLRIFVGMNNADFQNATDAIREKHCIIDIHLDQETPSSSNIALANWLVSQINAQYSDFTDYFGGSRAKALRAAGTATYDNPVLSIMTDYGFNPYDNVETAIEQNSGTIDNIYIKFDWEEDGNGLVISPYATNACYPAAKTAHNTAATSGNYSDLVASGVDYTTYNIFGFDSTWEEISGNTGIVETVDTLSSQSMVAAASDASLPEDIAVGFCYFNTTAGKPLWLKEISDDTYTWVDATGTEYSE